MSRKSDRLKRRHNGRDAAVAGAVGTRATGPLEDLVEINSERNSALSVVAAADRSLAEIVASARRQGYTWQEIGDALGVSRQAVAARFAAETDPRAIRRRALS